MVIRLTVIVIEVALSITLLERKHKEVKEVKEVKEKGKEEGGGKGGRRRIRRS